MLKGNPGTRGLTARMAALRARFTRPPQAEPPEPGGLAFIAVALLAVAVVAFVAFSGSWQHQYELSIRLGQAHWVAGTQPLSVEGLIVSATLVIWFAGRHGYRRREVWGAYLVLLIAVGQSVLMNLGTDHPWPWLGTEISVWPAVAFVAGYEMAVWMVRKRAESMRPDYREAPGAAASRRGCRAGTDAPPAPDRGEPRRVRAPRAGHRPIGPAALSNDEKAWTAELAAAGLPLPSYRSWSYRKTGMYRSAGTRRAYDAAREQLASVNGGSRGDGAS